MPPITQHTTEIRELVRRFHVCWDVWPEYAFVKHEKRQIGFELDLSGMHEGGEEHPEPGCGKCLETYQALVRIAQEVLPRGNNDVVPEFGPYDQGIHYSSRRGNRPEIVLRIRIIHRNAFERAVDAEDVHYLGELQKRLEDLGIAQH